MCWEQFGSTRYVLSKINLLSRRAYKKDRNEVDVSRRIHPVQYNNC